MVEFDGSNRDLEFGFVALLKECIQKNQKHPKRNDVFHGSRVHAEILRQKSLLEKSPYVASALINMYAKCGMLTKAQDVHDALPAHDLVSSNALIAGYAHHGHGYEALACYGGMYKEGITPNAITFTCILKACGSIKDPHKGKQLHCDVVGRGLLKDNALVGNALVDMYAKCGMLSIAHEVLDELPLRNHISWSSIIGGYAEQWRNYEALDCFEQMQSEGLLPDAATFVSVLKACGNTRAIQTGKQIHDKITAKGLLERNLLLGTALVDMYSKCGMLSKARDLHEKLPHRDVISWNALISGYVEYECGREALQCFEAMQNEDVVPDAVTFTCSLKACGCMRDFGMGKQIHEEIVTRGILEKNVVLGAALVDMYAKCGMLARGEQVLNSLPTRSAVSWCALISGYAQKGQSREALNCYDRMNREGFCPDIVTLICILKACGDMGAIDEGKALHAKTVREGLFQKDTVLGTAVVNMYVKCGMLEMAREVFEDLPHRNIVTWNVLISGHGKQGYARDALNYFQMLQNEVVEPDVVTFICVLNACGMTGAIDKGKQIHEDVVARGLLHKNMQLGNALVGMYAKLGLLEKARQVHDDLPFQDVVSCSILMTAYVEKGQAHKALNYFDHMQNNGISPDAVVFTSALKACGIMGDHLKGRQIHDEIISKGWLEKNPVLANVLVDMYARCGLLTIARRLHSELAFRDVASWSALIAGYVQQGQGDEALACFGQMQTEGISPDMVTFICMLQACGSIGALGRGMQIHEEVVDRRFLNDDDDDDDENTVLGTALVDMYIKCNDLVRARKVHDELPMRNTVTWNALMAGYGREGRHDEVLRCFEQMQREGTSPDSITFLCVLNSCSHSGRWAEARRHFHEMSARYGISPSFEHHACMVSVWGSVGWFEMAMSCIKTMPCSEYIPVWVALLSACRKWGNVELGRFAYDRVLCIDRNVAEAYVLMSTLYAAAGMHEDARRVEAMKRKNAVKRWNLKEGGNHEIKMLFSKSME